MKTNLRLVSTISAAMLMVACASQQPLSNYARTGDTVSISLGGTDSNALVSVLKKESITAVLIDAAGVSFPVTVRNVFRVMPDPTSNLAYVSVTSSDSSEGESASFVYAHQGLWMAVIDLVDPATMQAPALAVGMGKLSISSPELKQWVDYTGFGWTWTNGNLSNIPIEILPGTGSKNPLNYLTPLLYSVTDSLEPLEQLEIRVTGTPTGLVGGAAFTFIYKTADFGTTEMRRPRVTLTTPDSNIHLSSYHQDRADGTTLLRVHMANPHGFNVDNTKTKLAAGRSMFRSLRFNIMWNVTAKMITDTNWQESLYLNSSQYIDINGDPMPELTASVAKIR